MPSSVEEMILTTMWQDRKALQWMIKTTKSIISVHRLNVSDIINSAHVNKDGFILNK